MKTTFITICLILFSGLVFSSTNPILDFIIFDNDKVEVAMSSDKTLNNRISVKLYADILSFRTIEKINYIQIHNNQNKLLFQIPILSKKVEISKDLFDTGLYKLHFYFGEDGEMLSTQIKIK